MSTGPRQGPGRSPSPPGRGEGGFAEAYIDGANLLRHAQRIFDGPRIAPVPARRQIFDRLSSLQGKEFDREYMKAMVQGHQDVADMLERRTSASQGRGQGDQTSGLDQWAQRTLPTVRTHLEQARQISDSL